MQMGKDFKLVLVTALCGIFWTVCLLFVFLTSMPFNPSNLSSQRDFKIRWLAPQGWGFFTRNPQEESDEVYIFQKSNTWIKTSTSQVSLNNFFGINRKIRHEYFELSKLLDTIPKEKWISIKSNQKVIFDTLSIADTIRYKQFMNHRMLDSVVVITRANPLPWAWSSQYATVTPPTRVLKLRIINQ
jgi:antimicrobial peptide system SdpA family protein